MAALASGSGSGVGGNNGRNVRTTRTVLLGMIMACSLVYIQFVVQHQDTLSQLRANTLQDLDSFKGSLLSQKPPQKESQPNGAGDTTGNIGTDSTTTTAADSTTPAGESNTTANERSKEDSIQEQVKLPQSVEEKADTAVVGNDETKKAGEETTTQSSTQQQQDDSTQQQRSMLRKATEHSTSTNTNSQPLLSQPMSGSTTGRKPIVQDKITTSPSSKTLFIAILMAISGICEAICNRRFGCHPNMMTGNTVKCMDALSLWKVDVVIKLSVMIANYVAGAVLYGVLKNIVSSTFHVPILVCVARASFFCFCMSDMIVSGVIVKTASSVLKDILRLGTMALGFGMINAAANVQVGMVTNAVTKHWTDFGLGSTEMLLVGEASNGAWSNSGIGVVSFLTALLVTNIVQSKLEYLPDLKSKLPPLGTSLGVMYYLVFTWFASQKVSG